MNCNENICRVVGKVANDLSLMRELCCENPALDGCDQLVLITPQLSSLIPQMQSACQDQNWERIGDLWLEFKSLPWRRSYLQGLMLALCGEDGVDRGINSWPLFTPRDTFEFDGSFELIGSAQPIVILPGSLEEVWMGNGGSSRVQLAESTVVWEEQFQLQPGGELTVATWIGGETCSITGSFSLISHSGPGSATFEDFCKKELKQLDFRFEGDSIAGSLRFDPSVPSHIVVNDLGQGYLGAAVGVEVFLKAHPTINAEGIADVLWIELPVAIEGDVIVLGPGGAVDGLELFPVDAALEHRIRRRALGWTEDESTCAQAGQRVFDRFVSTYPECFGVHGE